jgi:hypothetical protein
MLAACQYGICAPTWVNSKPLINRTYERIHIDVKMPGMPASGDSLDSPPMREKQPYRVK